MTKLTSAHRLVIDVSFQSASWRRALPGAAAVARKMAKAGLIYGLAAKPQRGTLHRKIAPGQPLEVSIVLTGNAAVQRLNAAYRGKDKPTNVLSFPADPPPAGSWPLGDVIVAYGIAAAEARDEKKTLHAHLAHLVLHGVLHLLGYDHLGDRDANVMERLESEIMARMGYADPYATPLPTHALRSRPKAAKRRIAKSK